MAGGDGPQARDRGNLRQDVDDRLLSQWVRGVVQSQHLSAAVVIANHTGEGHDGSAAARATRSWCSVTEMISSVSAARRISAVIRGRLRSW